MKRNKEIKLNLSNPDLTSDEKDKLEKEKIQIQERNQKLTSNPILSDDPSTRKIKHVVISEWTIPNYKRI